MIPHITPWLREPYYPESDGEPVAETPEHFELLVDLKCALDRWFADDPLTYIAANNFVYYEQGDPRRVCAPDLYLVRRRPKLPPRRVWKTWEEDGATPDLIIELTSKTTRSVDIGSKMGLYAYLGVREYVLYDPLGDYLQPRFQGFRLVDGRYHDAAGAPFHSFVTGLDFRENGGTLRLYDPATERFLLTPGEAGEKVETEAARAEAESARAEAEAARAEAEAARADAAEAEVEALRRRLAALESRDEVP